MRKRQKKGASRRGRGYGVDCCRDVVREFGGYLSISVFLSLCGVCLEGEKEKEGRILEHF